MPFPRDLSRHVPIVRWAAAVLLAPVLPVGLFGLIALVEAGRGGGYLDIVQAAFLVNGYPAVLVIGVPAFLVLARFLPERVAAGLAGGLVGFVPWLAVGLLAGDPAQARFGTCTGTVGGVQTWCESLTSPGFLALVFGLGALGGLVYAAIAGRLKAV